MDAGQLRDRVSIEYPARVRDSSGGFSSSWAPLLPRLVGAKIEHKGGAKRVATAAGGEISVARTEITMRYIAGVTDQMRIVARGTAYRIQHINNVDNRNRWLVLTCETGVAA